MRVKFYLNYSVKQEEKAIYAHIYLRKGSNKAYIVNTGMRIAEKYWDKDSQKAHTKGRNKYFAGDEINLYLEKFKQEIVLLELGMKNVSSSVTPEEIEAALDTKFKKPSKEKNLFEYINEYVDLTKSNKSKGSYYKFYNLRNMLQEFQDLTGYEITFQSINLYFYDKYLKYLTEVKNHSNNTAHRDVKFLKTFMNWAYERGITHNDIYKKFQPPKKQEKDVLFLTRDELNNFLNFEGFTSDALARVRDVFCFACFTGARYSDVAKISREQIKDGYWHITTQKTGSVLKIPLGKDALAILERYKNDRKPLPVISNQKMNENLKKALQEAGIDEEITDVRIKGSERTDTVKKKYEMIGTHTARRTFVTLSLEAGMKPETIMKITGHSEYAVMKKYLKVTDKLTALEYQKAWND